MIPLEKPLVCHYTNKHNDSFVTQCCKNKDYCNKELKPLLGPPKNPGRVTLLLLLFLILHVFFY